MAELFWWFEVVKPSFVQPRVFDPQGKTKRVTLKMMMGIMKIINCIDIVYFSFHQNSDHVNYLY
jgi:hypothetical protein